MDSALTMKFQSPLFQFKHAHNPSPLYLPFPISKPYKKTQFRPNIIAKVSSDNAYRHEPIIQKIRTTAATIVLAATTASMIGKFQILPARAESPQVLTEEISAEEEKAQEDSSSSSLSEILESNSEEIQELKKLLEQNLEFGDNEEILKVLETLVSVQPENIEWKFVKGRVLGQMGETQKARSVFDEILSKDPVSFEALFENALLMDRFGEGEEVIKRLEEGLKIVEEESKGGEARDSRLINAQIQLLQKNVEEALGSYEELAKEDPNDFRPYFCMGVIYRLLDKSDEAREQFAKYRELSPNKFELEGYLGRPLSQMKVSVANNEENLN